MNCNNYRTPLHKPDALGYCMREQDLAHLKPCPGWQDPIVIVGAGPVGMSAALGLAHYGVPCVMLDDGEGPAIEGSRAIFMERHALEILGVWGPISVDRWPKKA